MERFILVNSLGIFRQRLTGPTAFSLGSTVLMVAVCQGKEEALSPHVLRRTVKSEKKQ